MCKKYGRIMFMEMPTTNYLSEISSFPPYFLHICLLDLKYGGILSGIMMEKATVNELREHPNYKNIIDEVVHLNIDQQLMKIAMENSETVSQAEALYVKYRILETVQ